MEEKVSPFRAQNQVLLVFSDGSLGGTSRSAITAARAWKSLGLEVLFLLGKPVHPNRRSEIDEIGKVVDFDALEGGEWPGVIHFHHGSWSPEQRNLARNLIVNVASSKNLPTLLTNNVFGVPDRDLDAWPGRRVVGVPSHWSKKQYLCGSVPWGRRPQVIVLPNAQDLRAFFPPTVTQSLQARQGFGLDSEDFVLLRVGSPIEDKWDPAYRDLVERHPHWRFIFVGAPPSLRFSGQNVMHFDPTADVEKIRNFYWAADAFVHAAHRGESFGNVILESVACGLPVVTIRRPLRDNGPWEFAKRLNLVDSVSRRRWASVIGENRFKNRQLELSEDRKVLQDFYSIEYLAQVFTSIRERDSIVHAAALEPGLWNSLLVSVRHNFLATVVKEFRLR
jgi:glycosyltransferase involved in cell wall biosynthesis